MGKEKISLPPSPNPSLRRGSISLRKGPATNGRAKRSASRHPGSPSRARPPSQGRGHNVHTEGPLSPSVLQRPR